MIVGDHDAGHWSMVTGRQLHIKNMSKAWIHYSTIRRATSVSMFEVETNWRFGPLSISMAWGPT